jgi:hypothetical protein
MPTRPRHRLDSSIGACAALWLVSACRDPSVKDVELDPPDGPSGGSITLTVNRDVDVLFVIDNSGSMAQEQNALALAFGSFVEVLERPEIAANYRIGFTTTDDGNPWCEDTTPEAGALQLSSCRGRLDEFLLEGPAAKPFPEACVDTCPEQLTEITTRPSGIDGDEVVTPRDWLERVQGGTNLPDGVDMVQAFGCVAPQGIEGCGYESPLESMSKALRRTQTQDDPAYGFVRANAVLSIIHLTDEEDCSRNPDFDSIFLPEGNRVFWSDPAAETPTSAVCWNAGVVCEGTSPYDCRAVDLDVDGTLVEARDADELAVLRPTAGYIDELQELESNKQIITPDQEVLVSVIAGVGSDGEAIYQDAADPQFQADFGIGPGCEGTMGFAIPPVRLREFADAFAVGDQRRIFSVCDEDYAPTLVTIAEGIAEQLKPSCMPACVADVDPDTPGLDVSCSLIEETPRSDGSFEEIPVPACNADGTLPDDAVECYVALSGDALSSFCADDGFNLEFRFVRREGNPRPGGSSIDARCDLSDDKETDCPGLP